MGEVVGRTHRRNSSQANSAEVEATMISGAFSRSRTLMARHDVSPHMTKWWKAVRPDEGQVSFPLLFCCWLRRLGAANLIISTHPRRGGISLNSDDIITPANIWCQY